MDNCVLQKWVQELTWKEQSSILTAIRGSDQFYNETIRSFVRWLRRTTLYDADVNGKFLHNIILPKDNELKLSLEYMTLHFVTHLMHAIEIIGYKCPDSERQEIALLYYKTMCEILHCNPETKEQMNQRLQDNREIRGLTK